MKALHNAEMTVVAVISFGEGRNANAFEGHMKKLVKVERIGCPVSMRGGGECALYNKYATLWRREAGIFGFQIEEINQKL